MGLGSFGKSTVRGIIKVAEWAGRYGPTPAGGAHFLDQAELDFVHEAEVVDVLLEVIREILALFVFRTMLPAHRP